MITEKEKMEQQAAQLEICKRCDFYNGMEKKYNKTFYICKHPICTIFCFDNMPCKIGEKYDK